MKICNQLALAWLLGVMVLGGAACSKSGSSTAITGAALTTNRIDDDSDNKVDESDEARCVCHDDDATGLDGAATDDKDNHADEGAAKADGGAHRHHHCECADGGHGDGDHQDGPGDHDGQHTQASGTAATTGK